VLFSPVRQHWITVYGGQHKTVYVYDSMAGSASTATQATVRVLAGKRARVVYSRSCTQQQPGSGDCGCYALAYATVVVSGGDPASYELIEDEVRPHLARIIRQQRLSPFPCRRHCYCSGQAGGRMLACDMCQKWFHFSCLSGKVDPKSLWYCRLCR